MNRGCEFFVEKFPESFKARKIESCVISSLEVDFRGGRSISDGVKAGFLGEKVIFLETRLADVYEQAALVKAVRKIGCEKFFLIGGGSPGSDEGDNDVFFIDDQVNLSGQNPLIGIRLSDTEERFPDMSDLYDRDFNTCFGNFLSKRGMKVDRGILLVPRKLDVLTDVEKEAIKFFEKVVLSKDIFAYALAARHAKASLIAGMVVKPACLLGILKIFESYA